MGKGSGSCDTRPSLLLSAEGGNFAFADGGKNDIVESMESEKSFEQMVAENKVLQSAMNREWIQPELLEQMLAEQMARELDIHPATALRLSEKQILGKDFSLHARFLRPTLEDIRSGEETAPGMEAGAQRLLQFVEAEKTIAVFGDYDVDGNTSATIMDMALEQIGAKRIIGFASAKDGFGLSRQYVDQIADQNVGMLITVDCGSDQSDVVEYAQSKGIEVVVLDHHNIDIDNPAEFHLNPRYSLELEIEAGTKLKEHMSKTNRKLNATKNKYAQGLVSEEEVDELQSELNKCFEQVEAFCPPTYMDIQNYEDARKRLNKWLEKLPDEGDHGTGSQLAWKFGSHVLQNKFGDVPQDWNKKALFLAGMGSLADMADMSVIENRAFARVASDQYGASAAPLGVKMLAEHFGEDPAVPGSLIRTRATLNLAKRTSRVSAAQIKELYDAKTPQQAQKAYETLLAQYEESTLARTKMEELAFEYIEKRRLQKKKNKEKQGFKHWAHAIIDQPEYVDYVGQAGIIAPKLAKEYGMPAVVFTRQGSDAEGHPIFKWSARNNQVEQQIGDLIGKKYNHLMTEACTVAQETDKGIVEKSSFGGHSDVVSGTCRGDRISQVLKVMDKFAEDCKGIENGDPKTEREHHTWTKRESNYINLQKLRVSGKELNQISKEAALLQPTGGTGNYPVRVSVVGNIKNIGQKEDPLVTNTPATLRTFDGFERNCLVDDSILQILQKRPEQNWEFAVSPQENNCYIKQMRPADFA